MSISITMPATATNKDITTKIPNRAIPITSSRLSFFLIASIVLLISFIEYTITIIIKQINTTNLKMFSTSGLLEYITTDSFIQLDTIFTPNQKISINANATPAMNSKVIRIKKTKQENSWRKL